MHVVESMEYEYLPPRHTAVRTEQGWLIEGQCCVTSVSGTIHTIFRRVGFVAIFSYEPYLRLEQGCVSLPMPSPLRTENTSPNYHKTSNAGEGQGSEKKAYKIVLVTMPASSGGRTIFTQNVATLEQCPSKVGGFRKE